MSDGYRRRAAGGPRLRADIVDVYVFRGGRAGRGGLEFLQLLRAGAPLMNTWHPVMGHIEKGESAVECAVRELREEVGLSIGDAALLGVWSLEQVHPYYVAEIDQVVLSPRFAAQVSGAWTPRLNEEHADARWVKQREAALKFMWPGQAAACEEVVRLMRRGSVANAHLRITLQAAPRRGRAKQPGKTRER